MRYQIGTPAQDKPKEKIGTYCILHTHSLILDSYETCLPRARRAWALCVRCSTIHSYRPDISSGPSADREDPPQNNPRLTLRGDVPARCKPQGSIPRLSQGCLITIHLPTQPPYRAKGKRQTLQHHHPRCVCICRAI